MTTYKKLLEKVLSGRSDANTRFDDLKKLLARLCIEERSRVSYHIFVRAGVGDMINLQREGIWRNPIKFDRFELSSPSTGWINKGTINA